MDAFYRKAKQDGVGKTPAEKQWLGNIYKSLQECLYFEDRTEEEFCNLAVLVIKHIISEFNKQQQQDEDGDDTRIVPVRYDIVCINSLMQSQQPSCFSNLKLSQSQHKKMIQEAPTGHKPLRRVYFLLVGKLTTDPKSTNLAVKDRCGNLYLEDNTGTIICQGLNLDLCWLDRLVIIPGWNYIAVNNEHKACLVNSFSPKSHYQKQNARQAYVAWKADLKPRFGPVADYMRQCKSRFKYALRQCRKDETQNRADGMARALLQNDHRQFWAAVADINNKRVPLATSINDAAGEQQIADMWGSHFKYLLNSVSNLKHKSEVENAFENCVFSQELNVNTDEIRKFFNDLPSGKSPGSDGLGAEHLKYASNRLAVHVALCFSAMLVHGEVPDSIANVILVPIVKDKTSDLSNKNNYRPIALTSMFSKVLEYVLLCRCEHNLYTSDNQFGFKKAHGTDMCIFLLKETIRSLSRARVGCEVGGIAINNLSYADDMCLISPSIKGLRKLIHLCEQYADDHDIIYNARKSKCVHFKASTKLSVIPPINLCGNLLEFVSSFNYLGHVFTDDLKDNQDILKQRRALCGSKHRSNSYLEITEACIPVDQVSQNEATKVEFEVVSSTLGLHILQNRCEFTIKHINIQGEITALSPIHRIRESVMFFVEITTKDSDTSVCLVVKGAEYSHWHNFIQLNEEYVFSYVIPTTLNKESTNSFPVYAVSRKTKFFLLSRLNFKEMTLQQVQDKYPSKQHSKRCDPTTDDVSGYHGDQQPSTSCQGDSPSMESVESGTSSTSRQMKQDKLCSYKGTITDVIKAEAGIYELDGKIRLYIGHQPCVSHGKGMRIGSKVTVFNAHFKSSKQVPCLRLCCCTLSSVVIVQFSPLATPYEPFIPQSSVFIHLLYFYHINLAYYQWMVDMADDMKKKFLPNPLSDTVLMGVQLTKHHRSDQKTFGVFYNLLRIPSPSKQRLLLPQSPRNIYQEFIDTQHPCWVVESQPISRANLYKIPSIADLKQILAKKAVREDSWQIPETSYSNRTLNDELYWRYQVHNPWDFKPPLLLVGYLEHNSKTGQLQLTDQTGSINCIIADYDTSKIDHICGETCQYPSNSSHRPFLFPYAKTWCVGQLLRIDKYQIINESFTVCRFPSVQHVGNPTYIDKTHLRSYVQFSMSDTVSLHQKKMITKETKKRKLEDEDECSAVARKGKCSDDVSCSTDVVQLFVVSHKDSLHLTQSSTAQNCELTSNIAVTFINSPKLVPHDRSSLSSVGVHENQNNSRYRNTGCSSSNIGGDKNQDTNVSMRADGGAEQSCGLNDGQRVVGGTGQCHGLSDGQRGDGGTGHSCEPNDGQRVVGGIGQCRGRSDGQRGDGGTGHSCEPNENSASVLPVRQVVLVLSADSVKWYHLLNPGQIYAFLLPRSKDLTAFQPQLPTRALQKVVKTTDCRTCLHITQDMIIRTATCPPPKQLDSSMLAKVTNQVYLMSEDEEKTRDLVLSRLCCKEEMRIVNVQDVIAPSSTSATCQISVKCRIISRKYYNPDSRFKSTVMTDSTDRDLELGKCSRVCSLGVSTLNNKAIRLLVCDISTPDRLYIYLELDSVSYPMGLLPGAIVTFRNLNKCTSRKSNIYCQYLSNSSVSVDRFAVGSSSNRNDPTAGITAEERVKEVSTVAHKYLCEYVQRDVTNTVVLAVSQIYAHVVIVKHISLRFSCSECGDIFKQGCCTNTRHYCLSTNSTFIARASFIIEDGTFEANVYCNDDQVASLLDLSPAQCQRLQECVYKSGEVIYRHKGNEYNRELEHYGRVNPVEKVLHTMCTSQLVCRPVMLCCKQFQPNQDTDSRGYDYPIRNWDVGDRQFQTKVLPRLHLFCTSLKSVNHKEIFTKIMAENTSQNIHNL
ncbi:CST complex subunit CTC1-like [Glandiceps talaboti]